MLKNGFREITEMPPKKKEEQTVEKPAKRNYKKKEVTQSNVVAELKPKMYVDTTPSETAYTLVKIEVKPIKIEGIEYYYEENKNKVYTKDFNYVGRYDSKTEQLCTEYPDSDSEPSFTL